MSKTILITGASTGFGRDTAETLAKAGHTVYASMRDPKSRNKTHADVLSKQGVKVGKIDVLVNKARIGSAGVTEAFTADQATFLFNTNVIGILRTSRAVLPSMREKHDGLIINLGSVLGRVTFPFLGIYGASKFAVEALTDSLRYEVSQLGVDVTLVQP